MKKGYNSLIVLLLVMAILMSQTDVYYADAEITKTNTPAIKQTVGKQIVKLTWKKTGSVKKYTIYRKTTGAFKKIKNVTVKKKKGSYTDKTVSFGITYYYKIVGKGLKASKAKKITVKGAVSADQTVQNTGSPNPATTASGNRESVPTDPAVQNPDNPTSSPALPTDPDNPTAPPTQPTSPGNATAAPTEHTTQTAAPTEKPATASPNPTNPPTAAPTPDTSGLDEENITGTNEQVIKVTQSKKLVLSGNVGNKTILCETDGIVVNIELDGVTVSNSKAPFITNKSSDSEIIITAKEGTSNTITTGSTYSGTDELINSEGDITFNGTGSISIVNSNSEINAVKSESKVSLFTSNLSIQSGKKGIVGKPVIMQNGVTTINSSDDCIKAKGKTGFEMRGGKVVLTSEKDAIASNKKVTITGGILELHAGDDGIQCGDVTTDTTTGTTETDCGYIDISGGSFDITSKDHAITANGTVTDKDSDYAINITGGTFVIDAEATYTTGSTNAGGGWGGGRPGGGMEAQKTSYDATGGDAINSDTGVKISNASVTTTRCNDGIQATYSIIINNSSLNITAYGKGLKAGSSDNSEYVGEINVNGGIINIYSLDDAIHSENNASITSGIYNLVTADDGIHANKTLNAGVRNASDSDLTIVVFAGKVGTVSVTPYEGYEAAELNIYSGNLSATVSDDGINAAGGNDSSGSAGGTDPFSPGGGGRPGGGGPGGGGGSSFGALNIYGGNIYLNASGDSIDSNGTITMSGGTLKIDGSNNGADDVIDWDSSFILSGGEIAAIGTSGVSTRVASTGSTQRNVMFKSSSRTAVQANQTYELKDSSGNVIFSGTTIRSCNVFWFTSASFGNGTYDLYIGGSKKGSVTFSSNTDCKSVTF